MNQIDSLSGRASLTNCFYTTTIQASISLLAIMLFLYKQKNENHYFKEIIIRNVIYLYFSIAQLFRSSLLQILLQQISYIDISLVIYIYIKVFNNLLISRNLFLSNFLLSIQRTTIQRVQILDNRFLPTSLHLYQQLYLYTHL